MVKVFIFLFFLITNCYAIISQKYRSSCALLLGGTRIYCYSGGYLAVGEEQVGLADTDLYYLDLTSDQKFIVNETAYRWIKAPDPSSAVITLEPSIAGTGTAISDTTFVVDGGYYINGVPRNGTIAYDAESLTWSSISNENRGLTYRIYGGTAVYVPNQNTVVYWGGLTGRYPGQLVNSTTVLHMNQGLTWTICPGQLPIGIATRYGHTATLMNDGQHIIYIGGRLRIDQANNNNNNNNNNNATVNNSTLTTNGNNTSNDNNNSNSNTTTTTNTNTTSSILIPYQIVPMEDILIYSTIDGTWTLNKTNADTISERYLHTATLIPKSDKILIYGGATDDGNESQPQHVSDYLLLLDLKTLTYEKISEHSKAYGAGARFGHSAILSNKTLIILFGFNSKGRLTNDAYFLSVGGNSNSQIGWLSSFELFDSSKPDGLSLGAIIGISIGAVVFFLIIVTLCLLMFVKWRKQKDRMTELQNEKKRERQSWVGNYNPNEYVEPTFTPVSDMLSSTLGSTDNITVKNDFSPPQKTAQPHKPNQLLYQPMISRDHQYNRSSSLLDLPASPNTIKPSL